MTLGYLPRCEHERVVAGAVEFVFPADDFCLGENRAESWEDFHGRFEREGQFATARGDFCCVERRAIGCAHLLYAIIAQRRRVKNGVCRAGFGLQLLQQILVRGERDYFRPRRCDLGRRALAFQAKHRVPGAGERSRQHEAQFAGGKIREPPDLIDRLVARPAGDDDSKNEEWRALVDRFRQIYNFRNLIIGLQIWE